VVDVPTARLERTHFVGVQWRPPNRWYAYIREGKGRLHFLGSFDEEERAAAAYDRVALYLRGPSARLNLSRRRATPATPALMREHARMLHKATKTSRYTGVYFRPGLPHRPWVAEIKPGRALGCWPTERDAAIAYDRAVAFYFGGGTPRNLPGLGSVLAPPTDAETLRWEARQLGKKRFTSRYLGVGWHGQAKRWQARIRVGNRLMRLGLFVDEEAAAHAYDRAALAARDGRARLNFDPVTGRAVFGRTQPLTLASARQASTQTDGRTAATSSRRRSSRS
jgi:hypothetical protein